MADTDSQKSTVEPPGYFWKALFNPVVMIALLILASVFALIGSAIIGIDKGVLVGMARIEFARGLITYLFAVVTIGTAVVLVVSALTGTESEVHEKRFQRGKEILALLLGVFGTMVGFYFGSEVGAKNTATLLVAPVQLDSKAVPAGGQIKVTTYVSGGQSPYKYGIGFGSNQVQIVESVDPSGWIEKTIVAPKTTSEQSIDVHIVIVDSAGNRAETSSPLDVKPQ